MSNITAVSLQSERLILKRLTSDYVSQDYVNWMNDSETNTYLESGGDYTLEKLQEFLEKHEKLNILFWAIHDKSSNKHIGNIKIDPINTEEQSGEYGILIGDKNYWNKGIAKEASKLVIEYCFNNLKLNAITLGVIEDNKPAIKLYKNLGFKVYDELINVGVYDGKACSSIRMVLQNDKA